MSNIVKVCKEIVPAMAFIGKRYGDEDRQNGGFGHLWDQWFQHGWFAPYQYLIDKTFLDQYPEAAAPIGLMRHKEGEPFEYWIGMFVPIAVTKLPEGTSRVEIPKTALGIGWVEGDWSDVFCQEERVRDRLIASHMTPLLDKAGAMWFFERYAVSRFLPQQSRFILDIGFFIAK